MPTYVQEQVKLREDTIAAFHGAVPDGEGEDFLVAREKTTDELVLEEEAYRAFLEREVGDLKKIVVLEREDEEIWEGEAEGKGKGKKGRSKEGKMKSRAEEDQEFLVK